MLSDAEDVRMDRSISRCKGQWRLLCCFDLVTFGLSFPCTVFTYKPGIGAGMYYLLGYDPKQVLTRYLANDSIRNSYDLLPATEREV
jgi:hypothetical protein